MGRQQSTVSANFAQYRDRESRKIELRIQEEQWSQTMRRSIAPPYRHFADICQSSVRESS